MNLGSKVEQQASVIRVYCVSVAGQSYWPKHRRTQVLVCPEVCGSQEEALSITYAYMVT